MQLQVLNSHSCVKPFIYSIWKLVWFGRRIEDKLDALGIVNIMVMLTMSEPPQLKRVPLQFPAWVCMEEATVADNVFAESQLLLDKRGVMSKRCQVLSSKLLVSDLSKIQPLKTLGSNMILKHKWLLLYSRGSVSEIPQQVHKDVHPLASWKFLCCPCVWQRSRTAKCRNQAQSLWICHCATIFKLLNVDSQACPL